MINFITGPKSLYFRKKLIEENKNYDKGYDTIIDFPEGNLDQSLHGDIADRLMKISLGRDLQVISNSDIILLRILRQIVKQKFPHTSFKITFCDEDKVYEIKLNELGASLK